MRNACLVMVLVLGGAAIALAQDEPRDLTPPEFLRPVEPIVEHEPSEGVVRFAAEFLYFTPRQRGLDFALVDTRNDLTPAGRLQSLNYRAEPGVRVALAYQVPGDQWDIGFTYTYFQSSDGFGVVAPPGGLVYPTLTKAGLTNEANLALANASLSMNVYDIEFGRHFEIDESFHARVFGGVRLATIRQRLTASYHGRDAEFAEVQTFSHYDGVGPLLGGEASWSLGESLGVFGRANAALLTGSMRNPFTETNNGGATVYADLRDRFALTVPVVTIGVGMQYKYRGFSLRAGYEVSNWFGLFERAAFVDDFAEGKVLRQSANLGLDGLFVQLGLEF